MAMDRVDVAEEGLSRVRKRWVARAFATTAVVCGVGVAAGAGCSADAKTPAGGGRYVAPSSAAGSSGANRGVSAADASAAGAAGAFGNSMAKPAAGQAATDAGSAAPDGSTGGDRGNCGDTLTLNSSMKQTTLPGTLLVLFDQSHSLQESWKTTTKLEAAKQALVDAITPLQDSLTVGAIFLPYPGLNNKPSDSCLESPTISVVQPIDGAGNIPFQPAAEFLAELDAHWSMTGVGKGYGSPLNEAFDRASAALDSALPKAAGKVAVFAFTDGMPSCTPNPAATMIPTKPEAERAADWLAEGVSTYVIGLPGSDGVQYLNAIAVAGGTHAYVTPDDPAMLTDQLRMLVEQQVSTGFDSCSLDLTPRAPMPDQVQLIVEEQGMAGVQEQVPHDLGVAGGWTIDADGANVKLFGAVCDAARSGKFARLTFEFGCVDVPTIPAAHVL